MGAEGPHADHKTAGMAISLEGFCSWTIIRPHTARDIKEHILRQGWERLDDPAYSPNLAPSDFLPFLALKSGLPGRHFRSNKEVRQAVKNFLLSLWAPIFTRMVSSN
ncbi:hypothetical protein AVEN_173832-1 [Araneus ventricosus]|uniref:Histone-lysine N-methyltransferase SETMAR n=1 Tax=Araneus ventricosus TaxID=182803 RepID=A0A4Y2DSE8_ARAVE|nr:hypothetical protein AVEN_189723-1 [Araneus ventricosus]GBM18763.1 hypothetical protein AVEN_18963-1 [Araneus ventricosus]GBM18789.1 hypothetical protein AVEN_156699-1 [Araneus ventricosus]GBM18803.1 hypothetical protein AVEN_173832-1 [Araneus ventricosus]